jgi:8-oxo-dGTP pyrophosphatase MutT (NUDIX family)
MKNLHLTVAAIIEDQGRFLMVEETVGGGLVINQPAGHVEQGETFTQAVIRETLEETAWHFTPEYIVGLYLWKNPLSDEHFLRVAFAGQHNHHDSTLPLDIGIERALWLTHSSIEKRVSQLRSPMVISGIRDYLRGHKYSLIMLDDLNNEELIAKAVKVED